MKTIVNLAALCGALLFTSCFQEIHELSPLKGGEGLLGTSLRWENPDDGGTPVHSLTVCVGGSAAPFSRTYKDPGAAASEYLTIAAGSNDVLTMVNMTEADGFAVSGLPGTKADAAVGDVLVSLKDPLSSPPQAWFGVSATEIRERSITVAEHLLQRLLATLSVKLTNVPEGTKVTLTLSNVARSVNLTAKDATGRYGLPGAGSVGELHLAGFTAGPDGILSVDGFTTLPTAADYSRCILTFDIISASGHRTQYVCDAPQMECGKSYTLELDYRSLRLNMSLDSYSINPWEEGWTVSGEVLNPKE